LFKESPLANSLYAWGIKRLYHYTGGCANMVGPDISQALC
jgi:hypothetical protein